MKTSIIYPVVFVIGMLAIGIAGYNLYDYLTNPKKPHAPIGYDITKRDAFLRVPEKAPETLRVERVAEDTSNYITNYFYVSAYWLNQSWGLIWSNGLDRPWGVCRDINGKLEQYAIKYPDKNK